MALFSIFYGIRGCNMSSLLLNSPGLLTEVDDLKPSDFKFLCLLGDGAYGDV